MFSMKYICILGQNIEDLKELYFFAFRPSLTIRMILTSSNWTLLCRHIPESLCLTSWVILSTVWNRYTSSNVTLLRNTTGTMYIPFIMSNDKNNVEICILWANGLCIVCTRMSQVILDDVYMFNFVSVSSDHLGLYVIY